MRQRYHISKEGTANDLIIREYAVIGKEKKRTLDSMPFEEDYVLSIKRIVTAMPS